MNCFHLKFNTFLVRQWNKKINTLISCSYQHIKCLGRIINKDQFFFFGEKKNKKSLQLRTDHTCFFLTQKLVFITTCSSLPVEICHGISINTSWSFLSVKYKHCCSGFHSSWRHLGMKWNLTAWERTYTITLPNE